MAKTHLNFENFARDAHEYVNKIAEDLGHPTEKDRALQLWRSVMHVVRDRIHFGESLQILDPLPMIFKGIYVQHWKFHDKPPMNYSTMKEMAAEVEKLQEYYGEADFPWKEPTEELIVAILESLREFLSIGQLNHVVGQLPKEVKEYLQERL